jgi:hypothetical protein
MGEIDVPADRYWGAQTQRSLVHFSIGDDRMPKAVYHAYGYVKKAAAMVARTATPLVALTRPSSKLLGWATSAAAQSTAGTHVARQVAEVHIAPVGLTADRGSEVPSPPKAAEDEKHKHDYDHDDENGPQHLMLRLVEVVPRSTARVPHETELKRRGFGDHHSQSGGPSPTLGEKRDIPPRSRRFMRGRS